MKYSLIIIFSIFYFSALPLIAEQVIPMDLCKSCTKNKNSESPDKVLLLDKKPLTSITIF